MKKLSFLFLMMSVFAFWSCDDDDDVLDELDDIEVVSFENQLTQPESEYKTTEGVKENPNDFYFKWSFKDSKNLLEFSHYYGDWGFGGGFTYTNKTDTKTPGFVNISAITGKGKFGKVYLTSKTDNFTMAKITNLQPDEYEFRGAWVTNTTYAYLVIRDGNDGNNPPLARKFKDGDYFKLTAIGYNAHKKELGRADFYLADFRNGKSKIVDHWEWFDWSSLEDAAYIEFELTSTDIGEYGINTPAYFCIDGITLEED